jgi:hypothetical protein
MLQDVNGSYMAIPIPSPDAGVASGSCSTVLHVCELKAAMSKYVSHHSVSVYMLSNVD